MPINIAQCSSGSALTVVNGIVENVEAIKNINQTLSSILLLSNVGCIFEMSMVGLGTTCRRHLLISHVLNSD